MASFPVKGAHFAAFLEREGWLVKGGRAYHPTLKGRAAKSAFRVAFFTAFAVEVNPNYIRGMNPNVVSRFVLIPR